MGVPSSDNEAVPAWAADIRKEARPVYAAIVEAIAQAVRDGRLAPGDRLPTQRSLARRLGVDLTTVTRAYSEAAARRLVEARVGRGTFVAAGAGHAVPPLRGAADMNMNLPPLFDDPALVRRMWGALDAVERSQGLPLLLGYQEAGGSGADRAAGVRWLRDRLPDVTEDRVLVAAGAQGALLAITSLLAKPGEVVCAEALAYPGFRALAAHLGVRIEGVAMDAEGLLPDAFDAACRAHAPKALYCTPTLNNPTTATQSAVRRAAVVEVARRHGVPIIEDDAYGRLPADAPPPLAALAPELSWHVAGVAKVMSPALRIAYVAAPDARRAGRLAGALRATVGMASPLTAAIARRWIEDGTELAILAAIRRETEARSALVRQILDGHDVVGRPDAFHAWLPLPAGWTRGAFTARLGARGVGVVMSDAFCTTGQPPGAVRLSLGAPETRRDLAAALRQVRELLDQDPVWALGTV
ncbi:MAG: PLP-dependent aminotransferase family protein [Caulobacteraceae bacterium]|nr:PLP-dependent aminotransferase family protein [Caulobacteraceae bacterium]